MDPRLTPNAGILVGGDAAAIGINQPAKEETPIAAIRRALDAAVSLANHVDTLHAEALGDARDSQPSQNPPRAQGALSASAERAGEIINLIDTAHTRLQALRHAIGAD